MSDYLHGNIAIKEEDQEVKKAELSLVETHYHRRMGPPAHFPKGLQRKYFISLRARRKRKNQGSGGGRRKPSHYKLVCISLYLHDIAKLEEHVQRLKSLGFTKANKSQVIRFAIDKVLVEQMPKIY